MTSKTPHSMVTRRNFPRSSHMGASICGRRQFLQTVDGRSNRGCRRSRHRPTAPSDRFPARLRLALPDASRLALHRLFPAERAHIPRAHLDLVPLHDLPQGCTTSSAVLASDASLLRVLGHCACARQTVVPRLKPKRLRTRALLCSATRTNMDLKKAGPLLLWTSETGDKAPEHFLETLSGVVRQETGTSRNSACKHGVRRRSVVD